MPMFTIITATHNVAKTIPLLVESLTSQTCQDFEWIVQDGSSTDDTLVVIEASRNRLPYLSLESSPDTGIYDAWNKALPRIRGKWVLFLGADDTFASDDVLQKAHKALSPFPKATYGVGQLDLVDSKGTLLCKIQPHPEDFLRKSIHGMPLPHSALFHNNILFHDYNFDDEYKISGDYDFLLKTWNTNECALFLPFVVTRMTNGGCSNDCANFGILQKEKAKIRNTYFPFSKFPRQRVIHALSIHFIWEKSNPAIRLIKSYFLTSPTGSRIWFFLQKMRRKFFRT